MDVPNPWKISRVIPILKKGDHKLVSNYRPVSNVSSLSKVFERAMLNKMRERGIGFIFGEHQHGFSPNRSTSTADLTMQDYIAQNLDKNRVVLMYSADLSAAFDMLRPDSLIETLLRLEFNPNLIKLIRNFLSDRTNFVQVKNSFSTIREVPIGCVQGSVIGPALFNIYTRNLGDLFDNEVFKLAYADDSYIGISCESDEILGKLTELSNIATTHYNWLDNIGMVCNWSKTEFIIFDRHRRFRNISLSIGQDQVKASDTIKVLGMIFQDDLKWSKQVSKSIMNANAMLLSLRFVNRFLNCPQFKLAIHVHFISRLTFGAPVCNNAITVRERLKLNVNLNKAIRLLALDFIKELTDRELLLYAL